MTADVLQGAGRPDMADAPLGRGALASTLLARDDRCRLHQLIDPQHTPPDRSLRSVSALHQALRLPRR